MNWAWRNFEIKRNGRVETIRVYCKNWEHAKHLLKIERVNKSKIMTIRKFNNWWKRLFKILKYEII